MSGCVIPVAPDFQDPAPNYPPTLTSAGKFPVGDNHRVDVSEEYDVLVWDPNGDQVYAQWVVDYPPFVLGTSNVISNLKPVPHYQTTPQPAQISQTVGCGNTPGMTPNSLHRLEVIVSDREPIMNSDGSPGDVAAPGFIVRGDWTFYLTCAPTVSP